MVSRLGLSTLFCSALVLTAFPKYGFSEDFLAPKLSREVAVAAPVHVTAPFHQAFPRTASDGSDFLVTWVDHRITPLGFVNIFAARVSSAGAVLDPNGIPLGVAHDQYSWPEAVWLGSEYLVVWKGEGRRTTAVRIRDDGTLRDIVPVHLTGPELSHAGFASNGRRSLLLSTDSSGALRGMVLREDLSAIGSSVQISEGGEMVLTSTGGEIFMVVLLHPLERTTRLVRISADGEILGSSVLSLTQNPQLDLDLASDGGTRFLLAYTTPTDRLLKVQPIHADGTFGTAVTLAPSQNIQPSIWVNPPSIAWTGTEFAIAWVAPHQGNQATWLARADNEGNPIAPPRLISSGSGAHTAGPSIVAAAGRLFTAWQRSSPGALQPLVFFWDLAGVVIPSPGAPPEQEFLLTYSAVTQERQAISSNGSIRMAVWTDFGESNQPQILRVGRIARSGPPPDGEGKVVETSGRPNFTQPFSAAIGTDGDSFLIVWERNGRLVTRRIAANAEWIDPEPRETQVTGCVSQQAMLWNGEHYLVVAGCNGVIGITLDRRGDPVGSPIQISQPGEAGSEVVVAAGADQFLVVWSEVDWCGHHSCGEPVSNIRAARVRNGSVIDAPALHLTSSGKASGKPAVAWGDGIFLVSWSDPSGVRGTRITSEGAMLDGSADSDGVSIIGSPEVGPSVVAWEGRHFLLFWRERMGINTNALKAVLIDPNEPPSVLPGPVGVVSEEYAGGPAFWSYGSPTVLLTREGVLVAYTRIAPEREFGGVKRIFARMIRIAQPRGRATRQ